MPTPASFALATNGSGFHTWHCHAEAPRAEVLTARFLDPIAGLVAHGDMLLLSGDACSGMFRVVREGGSARLVGCG